MIRVRVKERVETLCQKCEEGQVVEFDGNRVNIICHRSGLLPMKVHRVVVHCNDYRERNTMTRTQFERIAWVIGVDKAGKVKGFQPPKPRANDDDIADSMADLRGIR